MEFTRQGRKETVNATAPIQPAIGGAVGGGSVGVAVGEANVCQYNVARCQLAWLHILVTLIATTAYIGTTEEWENLDELLKCILISDPSIWELAKTTTDRMIAMKSLFATATDDPSDVTAFLKANDWPLDISGMSKAPGTIYVMLKSMLSVPWTTLTSGTFSYKVKDDKRILQVAFGPKCFLRRDTFGNPVAIIRFNNGNHKITMRITDLSACTESFDTLVTEHLTKDREWKTDPSFNGVNFLPFSVKLTSAGMNPIIDATIGDRVVSAVAGDGLFAIDHQKLYYDYKSLATISYRGGSKPLPDDRFVNMFDAQMRYTLMVELFVDTCPVLTTIVVG